MGYYEVAIVLVLLIASAAITALTVKRPTTVQNAPNILKDFNFPQIDEGTPQTVVFGDVWITDWEVLWYGDLRTEAVPAKKSGGKK